MAAGLIKSLSLINGALLPGVQRDIVLSGFSGVSALGVLSVDGTPVSNVPTPENTPGAELLWGNRAGDPDDWQVLTTVGQMMSTFGSFGGSNPGSRSFNGNVDGSGTNAMQWDLDAGTDNRVFTPNFAEENNTFYTSMKYFVPTGFTWATGMKLGLWHRGVSGGNQHRIYLAMGDSNARFAIDGLNYSSGSFTGIAPGDYDNTIVSITCMFQPSTGAVKAWWNGDLVRDLTAQNIETSPLRSCEFVSAAIGSTPTIAMWDMAIWRTVA